MMRYFIGFFLTIGLIIVLILLLFGGGKPKVPTTARSLDSYASTDAEVQMLIDGPVNAAQNHVQVQVTVGQYNTVYEQLQGYSGAVVNQQVFNHSEVGYNVFLRALTGADFTKGNTNPALNDDQGYCPLGERYVFELLQNGQELEHFWTTSCGQGTYEGNVVLTVDLFMAQVPGYSTLVQNVKF